MIPKKLKDGDHIRIIAPADSLLPKLTAKMRERAIQRLNRIGLTVSFGKHINEVDEFSSTSIEHRLKDLHDAFADQDVHAIMTVSGGTSSNQLLKHIDYDLIKHNPKIIVGLSDITAILNAIFTKTGLLTYYGPHYNAIGASTEIDFILEYFKQCLFDSSPISLKPPLTYYESEWSDRKNENDGYWIINEGQAEGIIIGGNLLTFNFLQGSEFTPIVDQPILLIEDNGAESVNNVQNQLQSLLNQPKFKNVRGILIGRFKKDSGITKENLTKVIKSKRELDHIPVLANIDFGHTMPIITFPIGGKIKIEALNDHTFIEITNH